MRLLETCQAYKSYAAMKQRCLDLNHPSSRRHGQRGITICARWLGPEGWKHFYEDMGDRPADKTLERRDNDGNYTPKNCRWGSMAEQSRNRSTNKLTWADVKKIRRSHSPQKELARRYGVKQPMISMVRGRKRWI